MTIKKGIITLTVIISAFLRCECTCATESVKSPDGKNYINAMDSDDIKWLSFDIPINVLTKALKADIRLHDSETPVDWVELLAYAAAENWGEFNNSTDVCRDIDAVLKKIENGENMRELGGKLKLFDYYKSAYGAVLNGFVGSYEIETADDRGVPVMEKRYGLKVFSPIAKGYSYNHYDDFGDSRSYGYRRRHLGNDLMASHGAPIIAVEGGTVEALGWNEFGGWRVGIRSLDNKRYYYYAHLKKDHPFNQSLYAGKTVQSGDVIGYLGMTGYSRVENVNNIKFPHLHFGMQIIFDESQKDGNNQIWIDVYNIINILRQNRMPVSKDYISGEYERALIINNYVD